MSNFAIAPRGDGAVNVSLTPELEAMIRQQVDSGRYNNASEVVREALRLLDEHQRVQHLRSLLAVGLEQTQRGELVEFTPELGSRISIGELRNGSFAARNQTLMSARRLAVRLSREADRDVIDILLYTRRTWGTKQQATYRDCDRSSSGNTLSAPADRSTTGRSLSWLPQLPGGATHHLLSPAPSYRNRRAGEFSIIVRTPALPWKNHPPERLLAEGIRRYVPAGRTATAAKTSR